MISASFSPVKTNRSTHVSSKLIDLVERTNTTKVLNYRISLITLELNNLDERIYVTQITLNEFICIGTRKLRILEIYSTNSISFRLVVLPFMINRFHA